MEGHRNKIVILGSGNVATHLAVALDNVADIEAVWSRNMSNARRLCSTLRNAKPTDNITEVERDADFYIVAISDDAIVASASALAGVEGIIAHTSGSLPLATLAEAVEPSPAGVFYPLQTFSRTTDVDIKSVPFLIEGTSHGTVEKLSGLASLISETTYPIDSATRGELHIAAVFANNFANYVWDIADRYLREHTEFDISVFRPLLTETLRKAIMIGPHNAQTGPARRNDRGVIEAHLAKLNDDEAEVYRLLTEKISKIHQ